MLTFSLVEGALMPLAGAGMEDVDAATRKALLEISLHLCCGNMDEAYKVCCEAMINVWSRYTSAQAVCITA